MGYCNTASDARAAFHTAVFLAVAFLAACGLDAAFLAAHRFLEGRYDCSLASGGESSRGGLDNPFSPQRGSEIPYIISIEYELYRLYSNVSRNPIYL